MRLLVYTLLRLGLVLAAAGVLYLLGLRSWILWIAAVLVGALLSFLVLGRQGRDAAAVLAQYDPLRAERPTFSPAVEADAAYEDAVVDSAGPGRAGGDVRTGGAAVGKDETDAAVGKDETDAAVGKDETDAENTGPAAGGTGPQPSGPERPHDEAGGAQRPTTGR
jgi:hypothetical protein